MRKRFFRAAVISIVAGLLIAFIFAVPLMDQVYTDEVEERLETALSLSVGYAEGEEDIQTMAVNIGRMLQESGQDIRLTIMDTVGNVLGDSEADPGEMENHFDRQEVQDALHNGEGKQIRHSETLGVRQMYLARKVETPRGELIYRMAISMEGFNQVQMMLWCCAGIGIFMGLVVALFAAHYAAGRLMEPLHSLIRAVRAIADGDVSVRVENAPDEMGELSGAVNRMSERLASAQKRLEQSNDQLAGILQGMDDGVVAVGEQGDITLMTNRARELLGECPVTVRRLNDCGVAYGRLQSLMDEAMETGHPVRDTLVLAGPPERILQVYASRVSSEKSGGALAVVADVTRIRKLEVIRSEFVANVTHELKTPLTSIRGYIELLKSEERDKETAQSFYDIIEIEADRLQKLTDDLLQLSEIENGTAESDIPLTSVAEIAERVASTLKPVADSAGVTLVLEIPSQLQVRIHARRLYQLMKNLMENAVKYNRAGGSVKVTAGVEQGVAVIRVSDTGIGISSEHLERIFERFYRVDKGRSRELGGTGLGLSIVKHIINLYGGNIHVESNVGKGTTFTVRLPLT